VKTKALLCLAALNAASLSTSMAQSNVYSLNVVGYVNVTLGNGDTLIANPLDAGNNSVSNLFTTTFTPLEGNGGGFTVFTWNGSFFSANIFDQYGGGFGNPYQQLPPGTGMFVFNGSGTVVTNTFVGNVMQGLLTNSLPGGDSLLGSQVPMSTNVVALGLTGSRGDTIFMWNGNFFVSIHYDEFAAGWIDPGDSFVGPVDPVNGPVLHTGQGLFYFNSGNNTPTPNWTINFSVPQTP
jgi:hypothetical protein